MIAAFAVPLALLVAGAGLGALSSANKVKSIDQQTSLSAAAAASVPAVQALEAERAYAVLASLAAAGSASLPGALRSLSPEAAGFGTTAVGLEAETMEALSAFQAATKATSQVAGDPFVSASPSPQPLTSLRSSWGRAGSGPAAVSTQAAEALLVSTYNGYTALIDNIVNADESAALDVSDTTLRAGVEVLTTSLSYAEAQWQVAQDLALAAMSGGAGQAKSLDQAKEDLGAALAWRSRLSVLSTGSFASTFSVPAERRVDLALASELAAPSAARLASLSPLIRDLSGAVAGAATSGSSAPAAPAEAQTVTVINQRASSLRQNAFLEAIFVLVLDGSGVLAGLALVLLVSRSVARPLVDLVRQADELARTALPATVHAILEAGASSEEPPEVPTVRVESNDEVADMARALDAVNKTAVDLALGQAELRNNLAEAFVNLGRRNQNLVTRQLEYLSEIELKEADPESLEELFRLDHLATRMRRNAESLLILAGSGPARQWNQAVPAMDVARAASAEVEDYKRLRLHHFDAALVAGATTTDLVHILAELIENALTFSPPASTVDIYGRFLEGAYVIVIVDSGIGMSPEDLETANRRLAGEDKANKVPGRYLGHFVAGKLASRYGIAIGLQSSHSGGVVARVKLPTSLIEEPVPDLSAQAELPAAPARPLSSKANGAGPTPASLQEPLPPPAVPSSEDVEPPGAPSYEPPTYSPPYPVPSSFQVPPGQGALEEQALDDLFPEDGVPEDGVPDEAALDEPAPEEELPSEEVADAPAPVAGQTLSDAFTAWAQEYASSGAPDHLAEAVADDEPAPDEDNQSRWDPLAARPDSAPGTFWTAPKVGTGEPSKAASAPESSLSGAAPAAATAPLSPPPGPPAPAAIPAPDFGILSPLAATNAIGGARPTSPGWDVLSSPKPAPNEEPQAPPHFAAQAAPSTSPAMAPPTPAPVPSAPPAPPPALPARAPLSLADPGPTARPAQQARSTADGLRRLTRRVPGAALEHEDGSLRRATPTSTSRNPLGVAGALSQYLQATTNDGRNERAEKEQDAQ
ncbi:MAG TPA: ATP-binding protein [Acidimicrobiales bacterium]|nr:ATP-binding protein [Acidimicrobiales bacterium]